jgi:hypothetical protein
MARPQKQTVDYFSHSCTSGKTIFILEQKYGNDGYAFWFKLLEQLGRKEGHFIDLSDEVELLHLTAISRVSAEKIEEILDLLVKVEAIDKPLWVDHKVIWCEKFVDGLSDLYARRKVEKPNRMQILSIKGVYDNINSPEIDISQQNDSINPNSIVKDSIVKDSIEEEGAKAPARKVFIKPTVEELIDRFVFKNLDYFSAQAQAQKFFTYYESVGWRVGGKAKMKDWKSAVDGWVLRINDFTKNNSYGKNQQRNSEHGKTMVFD